MKKVGVEINRKRSRTKRGHIQAQPNVRALIPTRPATPISPGLNAASERSQSQAWKMQRAEKPKKMGKDKKKKPLPSKLVAPVRQLEKAAKFLKDQPSPKPSKWERPTTADKSGSREP